MSIRETNKNICKFYKSLRDYVKNVLNTSVTDLEGQVADAIALSDKSVQCISAGKRDFKWGEAKDAALYFIEKCKNAKDCNPAIFRQLLFDFLMAYGSAERDSEVNEKFVDDFLKKNYPVDSDTNNVAENSLGYYSNLPQRQRDGKVVRNYLLTEIQKGVEANKIIFLSGFVGTGKSFIANMAARDYLNQPTNNCRYAIWSPSTNVKLTFNDLLTNILTAFDYPNAANLANEEKVDSVERCLSGKKVILVIDGLESIDEKEQRKILRFLTESVPDDNLVIVTSEVRMNMFRNMLEYPNRFREIEVTEFTYEEWEELSDELGKSRNDIMNAKSNCPEINRYVYESCHGNLNFMMHILSAVADKLLMGISFEKIRNDYLLSDLDSETYEAVMEKSLKDLSDNDRNLLISLSLFAAPVSLKVLGPISGLDGMDVDNSLCEGSVLATSISKCRNLYLLDSYFSDGEAKFSLSMLRPIMDNELKKNRGRYESIIQRWLDHYVQYSKNIGFCFDDFYRLEQLDHGREIDNIKTLLYFCEREHKWSEYYIVSENTRYYFYTRGISGDGKESIHYKRAYAARMLGNHKDEFDSLLYHCNVACKTKSWDDFEECLNRLEEMQNTMGCIPVQSRMKYIYLKALLAYSTGKFKLSTSLFEEYESEMVDYEKGTDVTLTDKQILHDYVAGLRWHCECLYSLAEQESDQDNLTAIASEAESLLDQAFELAQKTNFERAIVHSQLIRIKFYRYILKDKAKALQLFETLKDYKRVIENDVSYRETCRLLQASMGIGAG